MANDNEICEGCGCNKAFTVNGVCPICEVQKPVGIVVPASFLDKVRALLEAVGPCTCHQDYVAMRGRGVMRYDPTCFYCRVDGEITAVREALAEIEKGAAG